MLAPTTKLIKQENIITIILETFSTLIGDLEPEVNFIVILATSTDRMPVVSNSDDHQRHSVAKGIRLIFSEQPICDVYRAKFNESGIPTSEGAIAIAVAVAKLHIDALVTALDIKYP